MDAVIQTLIEQWGNVSATLLIVLFALGVLYLVYTDRLTGPKAVDALRADKARLETERKAVEDECKRKDLAIEAAVAELADQRVLNARSSERIAYQEERLRHLEEERARCHERLQRLEIERDAQARWRPEHRP